MDYLNVIGFLLSASAMYLSVKNILDCNRSIKYFEEKIAEHQRWIKGKEIEAMLNKGLPIKGTPGPELHNLEKSTVDNILEKAVKDGYMLASDRQKIYGEADTFSSPKRKSEPSTTTETRN